MKKILLLLAATATLAACEKDSKNSSCATGKIRITNTSKNPYNVYVNGNYKTQMQGGTFSEYDYPKGHYAMKAEQVSGYVLYPTVATATIDISGCDSKEFVFP